MENTLLAVITDQKGLMEELLGEYKLNFLGWTENSEKITLASFHLLDNALQWYWWFEKTRTNVSWEEFTHALCVRFGPSDYEDFDETLAKLRQTSTVREYQANFECLVA